VKLLEATDSGNNPLVFKERSDNGELVIRELTANWTHKKQDYGVTFTGD
jgi:hypothetical protein